MEIEIRLIINDNEARLEINISVWGARLALAFNGEFFFAWK